MDNPYQSPRTALQPLESVQSLPRQWRLAAWLGVFTAVPAIAMALMLAMRVQQAALFVFFGSLAFSIVGLVALLRHADCSLGAKVTIFLLAVFCSFLAASIGVFLLDEVLQELFDLHLIHYPPMED